MTDRISPIPEGLAAPGATGALHVPMLPVEALPAGTMRRVAIGDLDILLAHTTEGIVATDDRCPHMSAPLSLGVLDGCAVACPLHRGVFDLATGETLQRPTTGGLDADGVMHPTWAPAGSEPKPHPPGANAEARKLTRTRRIRFYPVRIRGGTIEVALPREVAGPAE
jgi:nitrite reductase/ring-hydroxylating ferredoxin subunit